MSSLLWQTLLLLTKHVRASHTDLTLCRCVCLFVCPCVCLPSLVSLSHTPLSLSLNLSLRDRVHFQRSFQRLHPKMRGTRWGRWWFSMCLANACCSSVCSFCHALFLTPVLRFMSQLPDAVDASAMTRLLGETLGHNCQAAVIAHMREEHKPTLPSYLRLCNQLRKVPCSCERRSASCRSSSLLLLQTCVCVCSCSCSCVRFL